MIARIVSEEPNPSLIPDLAYFALLQLFIPESRCPRCRSLQLAAQRVAEQSPGSIATSTVPPLSGIVFGYTSAIDREE